MLQPPRLHKLSNRWEESVPPGGPPLSTAEETGLKDLEQQYGDRVWEVLADFTHARPCKPKCEKYLTLPKLMLLGHRASLKSSIARAMDG